MSAAIDSRRVQPGDTFYALRGDQRDGHDFVEAALAAGAASAVIARSEFNRFAPTLAPRLRLVDDPLQALQSDAHRARRAWGGPLVAITGSAGKTTTKEMIAAVLATQLRVLKSEANFNNHLGVPLTLLRLRPEHQVAVVEMGMNHAGEIAALAAIAEPNVAVFTNVGTAHLENFGSIAGIAAAKRELALAIPPSGTLVLNRDDARVAAFAQGFTGRVCFYSGHDVTAPLQLPGQHNRANAAAALAVAGVFGVPARDASSALATLTPLAGRGEILHHNGLTIIQDCYNANPEAMMQMLHVLAALPAQRHIAVLGEMRELGPESPRLHQQVGAVAAAARLDALWAVGAAAQPILAGAHAAGFAGATQFAPAPAALIDPLQRSLRSGDAILFKASHSIHLETAVQALLNR